MKNFLNSEQMIKDNEQQFNKIDNLYIEFDMDRSGCQITWDYFSENKERPFFVDYIADRDLWKWTLPNSKEINNAMFNLNYINPYDLTKITQLLENIEEKKEYLKTYGSIVESINEKEIKIGLSNAVEATMTIDDKKYKIWLGGNISHGLRSEFGNKLCYKQFKNGDLPDFSVIWMYSPNNDEWWINLRGLDSGPDLSVISKKFGGGGHKNASGLTIKHKDGLRHLFEY